MPLPSPRSLMVLMLSLRTEYLDKEGSTSGQLNNIPMLQYCLMLKLHDGEISALNIDHLFCPLLQHLTLLLHSKKKTCTQKKGCQNSTPRGACYLAVRNLAPLEVLFQCPFCYEELKPFCGASQPVGGHIISIKRVSPPFCRPRIT